MIVSRCRKRLALAIAALALLLPCAAAGQVSYASVNGTVQDTTGAVVPGANVLLRNTQTGVETRTTTNEQGIYVMLNILPGPYTLEASKQGFSTSRMEPFTLVVNQNSVFDFKLGVGRLQESVTVEATATQIQSATAELGSVLTSTQVVDLPFGRSIQNLMRLTPGVNPVDPASPAFPRSTAR